MTRSLVVIASAAMLACLGILAPPTIAAPADEPAGLRPPGLRLYVYTPRAKEPCDLPLAKLIERRGGQLPLQRVHSAFEVTWAHGTVKVISHRRAHEDLGELDARPRSGQCFVLDHGDSEPIRGMVLQPQSERLLRGPALVLLPDSAEHLTLRLLPAFPASLGDPAPQTWTSVLKD